jgi:hypothetical protein
MEAVCCSSVWFLVTRDTVRPFRTENVSRRNKKMEGTNGPDPLSGSSRSKCQPARIVSWEAPMIDCGLSFLKAIGSCIHTVCYLKKRKRIVGATEVEKK